jgi:hypothetical protein
MGRTAYTEPQCLYSRAIPLLPLWAVRSVQSLSACARVHFTFTFFSITLIVNNFILLAATGDVYLHVCREALPSRYSKKLDFNQIWCWKYIKLLAEFNFLTK